MKQIELKTERLLLRQLDLSDVEDIMFLRTDAVVNRYVNRDTPKNHQDVLNFIEKIVNGVNDEKCYYWCITKQHSNKLIGTISLWNFSENKKKAEIGYDLHPKYHGQGIMSEALQVVVHYGFKELKIDKLEAFTHFENLSSINLLLKNKFKKAELRIDTDNQNNRIFELTKAEYYQPII